MKKEMADREIERIDAYIDVLNDEGLGSENESSIWNNNRELRPIFRIILGLKQTDDLGILKLDS